MNQLTFGEKMQAGRVGTGGRPAALYEGYNSLRCEARAPAAHGRALDAQVAGQIYYQVCSDLETLMGAINLSGSIAAPFGFGVMCPKAAFMAGLKVTTTSIAVVVYASVVTDSEMAAEPALLVGPDDDAAAFFAQHGDGWVSKVVRGAEYIGVHVFYAQSAEQRQSVLNLLAAHGLGQGGRLDETVQAALDKACAAAGVARVFRQFCAGLGAILLPAEAQAVAFAQGFDGMAPAAPEVLSFEVRGHETLAGMPAGFAAVVRTRRLFNGCGVLDGLAYEFARLGGVTHSISHILRVYESYGFAGDETLRRNLCRIKDDCGRLVALFERMDDDPSKGYLAPSLPALALGAPVMGARAMEACWSGPAGV